jgi:16S rRNA (uracil1498-N3)-methyltransferase
MADRFYVNCPLAAGTVVLSGPEAHHLATVLRARPGIAICLFNGDGAEYPAVISDVQKKQVTLEVIGRHTPRRELDFRLDVAAPLPKADRGDFLVEKLTELGVTRFIPLRTKRSVVHPREGRADKLERAVIEASKQCGRNVLMLIGPLKTWADHCRDATLPSVRLVAHPGGESMSAFDRSAGVAVAVGPEGGFTDEEIATAQKAGWQVVDLGPRVMRIETAAVALAILIAGSNPQIFPRQTL